ncbi:MAG: rRNA pseudouridine synthase [Tissierellales bacterium]|jgi:23S rRNA pseudouridine2605 synthase|nr:rRNA pseudouridine synthase [Tissierellales bacterium]
MRLQKFMALCGVASRRKSEVLIQEGKVKVNGKIIKELGFKIDPDKDVVEYNHSVLKQEQKKVYIMLNKPVGYVTTSKDQFNRPTVLDFFETIQQRIYPIGRLDYNTSGLLLLTNDGDFANKLTHPKHKVEKIYWAKIKGFITNAEKKSFERGLLIDGKKTSKASIKTIKKFEKNSVVEIVIREGRNRQVRKMCAAIGHDVLTLERRGIGIINLDENLKPGKWRHLTKTEVEFLNKK